MSFLGRKKSNLNRLKALAEGQVVAEQARCVQCGICTFNCPINIDVRRHAWSGTPVHDSYCLSCGECVMRCPRGALQFEPIVLKKNLQTTAKGD